MKKYYIRKSRQYGDWVLLWTDEYWRPILHIVDRRKTFTELLDLMAWTRKEYAR